MNTKNMKRWVLGGSLVSMALVYVFENPILFHFCVNTYTFGGYIRCADNFSESIAVLLFSISLPLLSLSLLTYRMKDEVFRAWFNFAKWWVPIIIATTLYFELKSGGGGGWGIGSGLDQFVILWLLYIIFIVTSLVKIVRAYLKTK